MREDRARGLYWQGTAGLALLGDADARAELLALVREGRTGMYDHVLPDPLLLTCNADPEFIAAWIGLLESNCCLAWRAQETLTALYPTLPVEAGRSGISTSAEVAEWLRSRTFRFSSLVQAWLPLAQ
jgi:hypothetical protein